MTDIRSICPEGRRRVRPGWCIGTSKEEATGVSLRLCGWCLGKGDTIDKTEKSGDRSCGKRSDEFGPGHVGFEVLVKHDHEVGCGGLRCRYRIPENLYKHIKITYPEVSIKSLGMNVVPPPQWKLSRKQTWFVCLIHYIPQCKEQRWVHRKCSVNMCWVNEWMNEWRGKEKVQELSRGDNWAGRGETEFQGKRAKVKSEKLFRDLD